MSCRFYTTSFSALVLGLILSGCSSVKVWPFDDSNSSSASTQKRGPANATEYQCNAGKRFYVRTIDNGNAVWLIYPDREVALTKSAVGKYTNGVATLDISSPEATLTDGPTINYAGCKTTSSK